MNSLLSFLTFLYQEGLSFSTLNVARSAVSQLISIGESQSIGEHALIKRFFKGVFRNRPPQPRYSHTWDVGQVLNHLRTLGNTETLDLKSLTLKTVMLTALLSGQRCQSIHLIQVNNVQLSEDTLTISITGLIKQSRPGFKHPLLQFKAFLEDAELCIVKCFSTYLKATSRFHLTSPGLFVSYVKPHKAVSRDTIRRWVKCVMQSAGIDTSLFTAHSTRSASTSAASLCGLPLEDIIKTAGWSSSSRTFDRFYHRHTRTRESEDSASARFAAAVLSKATQD